MKEEERGRRWHWSMFVACSAAAVIMGVGLALSRTSGTTVVAAEDTGLARVTVGQVSLELPPGFAEVDTVPMQYEGYEMVGDETEPNGETWPVQSSRFVVGGVAGLEGAGDDAQIIGVAVIEGQIRTPEEVRAAVRRHEGFFEVEVAGRPALRTDGGSGWIGVQWLHRPGLGISVTGYGVDDAELLAVAESIQEVGR